MTKWAMLVVVGDEIAENRFELPAMEYQHRVESLPHRIGGDAAHMDPRGVEIDGEEHVETTKEHLVDVEEVITSPAGIVVAWARRDSDQAGPERLGDGSTA